MLVVIPYTARHPDTLRGAPNQAEWIYVGDDDHAYSRAMCAAWERCALNHLSLLVIEHDVVCRPDVVASAETCEQPWCIWPYDNICHWECMENWRNALGCTRFSAQLIVDVPRAVSSIPYRHRDWHNLCDGIGDNLRSMGWTHHWHQPAVHHHQMSLAHLNVTRNL